MNFIFIVAAAGPEVEIVEAAAVAEIAAVAAGTVVDRTAVAAAASVAAAAGLARRRRVTVVAALARVLLQRLQTQAAALAVRCDVTQPIIERIRVGMNAAKFGVAIVAVGI